ncbi:hypothetical protein SASPL_132160 [Salvia splendens]|uniref:DUF7870 domain-containing protein n=1 Tax=Salvia splendens TaxID=180675 RepID=A0A8X8XBJ2_SALSN|nr:uncharacterized protein LOC121756089 [Salvia splendens]KAG6409128.1 hypothetical protein SASPL_132160 [Salvia splendens]
MDKSGRARRIKSGGSDIDEPDEFETEMNYDAVFVVRLPDSRSLRVVSRSLFLAVVLLSLPSIGSIIRAASNEGVISDWIENLPLLLRDLEDEGLLAEGHRGFVAAADEVDFAFLRNAGVDFSVKADAHQVFDYIYAPNFSGIELVEDAIHGGGLAIAPLGGDISAEIRLLRDFKIVYLRRINGNTVVAMRKNSAAVRYSGGRRGVICSGIGGGRKKEAALKGLDLEPPRAERESRFNYLPDLMEDPLDGYRRRVFVADEDGAVDWFYKNYPMRGQEFEVYGMEGEWDWGAEDFVVVKAEARAAERMLREKTICVVDELFLDCREEEEGRAFWKCVELYGKIRSEGIAVHQWWF